MNTRGGLLYCGVLAAIFALMALAATFPHAFMVVVVIALFVGAFWIGSSS